MKLAWISLLIHMDQLTNSFLLLGKTTEELIRVTQAMSISLIKIKLSQERLYYIRLP